MSRIFLQIAATLLVIVLGTSCKEQTERKREKMFSDVGVPCIKTLELIQGSNSLPSYQLDFKLSLEETISEIENLLGHELCEKPDTISTWFDLVNIEFKKTENSIPLKLLVSGECEGEGIYCGIRSSCEILLNLNNMVLLEEDISTIDGVAQGIKTYYSDVNERIFENPKRAKIRLRWDSGCSTDSISKLFSQVVRGYYISAQEYSIRSTGKGLCTLTEREMDKFRNEFPFNFQVVEFRTPIPQQPLMDIDISGK